MEEREGRRDERLQGYIKILIVEQFRCQKLYRVDADGVFYFIKAHQ